MNIPSAQNLVPPIPANFLQNTSGKVVYIDESYCAPAEAGGDGFYILAFTVVARENLEVLRLKAREIAGTEKWHTNAQTGSPTGRQKIHDMATFIGRNAVTILVVKIPVKLKFDRNGENARKECFATGLNAIKPVLEDTALIIMDKRPDGLTHQSDNQMIHEFRQDGTLTEETIVYQTRPWTENLLWMSDTAAWVYRREFFYTGNFDSGGYYNSLTSGNRVRIIEI